MCSLLNQPFWIYSKMSKKPNIQKIVLPRFIYWERQTKTYWDPHSNPSLYLFCDTKGKQNHQRICTFPVVLTALHLTFGSQDLLVISAASHKLSSCLSLNVYLSITCVLPPRAGAHSTAQGHTDLLPAKELPLRLRRRDEPVYPTPVLWAMFVFQCFLAHHTFGIIRADYNLPYKVV